MRKILFVFSAMFGLILGSCKPESDDSLKDANLNLNGVLENYADSLIIPAYKKFNNDIIELESILNNFNDSKKGVLEEQVKKTYIDWQDCAFYGFGPGDDYQLEQNINIFPVDTIKISQFLKELPDDISASSLGSSKGLPTLSYLILDKKDFSTSSISYLKIVVSDMKYRVENTLNIWQKTYRDVFIANKGTSVGSSVSFLLNAYIKHYERNYRDGKLGFPLGVRGNPISPRLAEAYNANLSNQLLVRSSAVAKDIYYGKSGLGIDDLVNNSDKKPSQSVLKDIENRWEDIIIKTINVKEPIESFVVNKSTDASSLYSDIQLQLANLKIEVLNTLSISITFDDSDGD